MRQRPFGNTGLCISEVVFGAGAVGGLLIDADHHTRKHALKMALDAGINWIDTAPSYGSGKSEEAIGRLLQEIPIERHPYISTKVRFDPSSSDFIGQAERSIEESLNRLKRDSVDLLQVHNGVLTSWKGNSVAISPDDVLRRNGVADALDRLVAQGLTQHIGFTGTGDAESVRTLIASGRFASVQIYYNLLNPSAGRSMAPNWSAYDQRNVIATAEVSNVAVMAIRVLAAGVIATDVRTGREGGVITDNDVAADERRMAMVLPLLKKEYGQRSQIAIRYVLSNSSVSGALVGIAKIEHLQLAIAAAQMGPLPAKLLADLNELADSDFSSPSRATVRD